MFCLKPSVAQKGASAALDSIDGDVEITARMCGSQLCPTHNDPIPPQRRAVHLADLTWLELIGSLPGLK